MFTSRFDGQSKLLVRSLLCGASGIHRAMRVFSRQQRADPGMSLSNFIDTLCQDELAACPEAEGQPLSVQPLVCLFPALFKQNLLSFIHVVHQTLPRTTVLHLLKCLSQDTNPSPWVSALVRQLERNMTVHSEEPLYTPLCNQRIQELSQSLVGLAETGGWAKCLSVQPIENESQRESGLSELGTPRKRRASFITLDSDDEETGQQSKRIKMDPCGSECLYAEEQSLRGEISGKLKSDFPAEELQPAPDSPCEVLPEHLKILIHPGDGNPFGLNPKQLDFCFGLKMSPSSHPRGFFRTVLKTKQVFALQMKELLESQTEWDQSSVDVLKVLNECNPAQVEMLCSLLSLPDLQEQNLPKLCSSILAPSPDLSYSTATTLIKSLLLKRVLSLSEPASRCLVTAVTSLCTRYPRPMCHALIRPALEENDLGNPQAELLNKVIEGCLDSHYRLLVLQMTFKVAWSEAMLSIIHTLLDSKPDFSEELFTQFNEQLISQGPKFTKSVKFAKMMLTVLTKCGSYVTAAHKHSLHSCLMLNETFLKKSLQAALKRITHS